MAPSPTSFYGKKRRLLEQYTALARAGQWMAGGVMCSPIRQVAPDKREWIRGRLHELGVV